MAECFISMWLTDTFLIDIWEPNAHLLESCGMNWFCVCVHRKADSSRPWRMISFLLCCVSSPPSSSLKETTNAFQIKTRASLWLCGCCWNNDTLQWSGLSYWRACCLPLTTRAGSKTKENEKHFHLCSQMVIKLWDHAEEKVWRKAHRCIKTIVMSNSWSVVIFRSKWEWFKSAVGLFGDKRLKHPSKSDS